MRAKLTWKVSKALDYKDGCPFERGPHERVLPWQTSEQRPSRHSTSETRRWVLLEFAKAKGSKYLNIRCFPEARSTDTAPKSQVPNYWDLDPHGGGTTQSPRVSGAPFQHYSPPKEDRI